MLGLHGCANQAELQHGAAACLQAEKNGPRYHVAYRDIMQPPRWQTKGWTGIDDYSKGRRGTAASSLGTAPLVKGTQPPK